MIPDKISVAQAMYAYAPETAWIIQENKMFEDNQKKLYIIVNRTAETPLLMNAIGHVSAGIMQKSEDSVFHDYPNNASGLSAYLSHYPVVILQAKNSNQLGTAVVKCQQSGILYNFFTTTMLGASTEQQIASTRNAAFADLEFVAVALYGDTAAMTPVTKKFSLFK